MVWIRRGCDYRPTQQIEDAVRRLERLASATGEDIYITYCRCGQHREGSRHPEGNAIDFRPLIRVSLENIKAAVGTGYDCLDEGNHIHLEYDPK